MSSLFSPTALLALLIALTVHECAHAWASDRLGDHTAKHLGRLTLNPVAHLDPIGTMVFLVSMWGGIPFGWAKPVPVDPRYLRHPKRDMALIALAGPASNFVLAIVSMVALVLVMPRGGGDLVLSDAFFEGQTLLHQFVLQFCSVSMIVNIGLMAFNLLPIAPLDGSKILYYFVPVRYEAEYQTFLQNGLQILLIVLILDNLLNIPIISWWFTMFSGPFLDLLNVMFVVVG